MKLRRNDTPNRAGAVGPRRGLLGFICLLTAVPASPSLAQPTGVDHTPTLQSFGEAPGITMREPDVAREGEQVDLYIRVNYQFTYDRVAVYYTTDGTEPSGAFGSGIGTTQVATNIAGGVTFLRNENTAQGTRDWWKFTLPAFSRDYGRTIKYKLSAWQPFNGAEVFANSGNSYTFTNKLPWPGGGAGSPNVSTGYPPVSFWKEEAIFGNQYCAGQIDQNGTVYDFHFPTPGGVYGVGTHNEGYVDGLDTFPAGLPLGWRGQMHLNQAMPGLRVDGVTYWLSNQQAAGYTDVAQSYIPDTNTIQTTQRLVGGGNNISVTQHDFAPSGVAFPNNGGGQPQRHIYMKRMTLTNNTSSTKTVDVYWYFDPALNGGDGYDSMIFDSARNAIVASDNTYRIVQGTGTGFFPPEEYNPTTSNGYEKNKSLSLACAMKVPATVGGGGGSFATENWADTSTDGGQGWIGKRITLAPNTPVEVDIIMAGAMDNFAGATGTFTFNLAPVMLWFSGVSAGTIETTTNQYWSNWLHSGTTVVTPDANYNSLLSRGLLATALHCDAVNGGVIAGFHNGAYPYVWPRDAVYAAITLARTGHLTEARNVYEWMKTTCFRDFESWGRKGFWKQKYSTDGYVIWGAPQIDETACFPWGVKFQYDMTGDTSLLNTYIEQIRDSVLTMTNDSIDSRLRFEEAFNLSYSNNVWEDSYDTFIYSNANIVRGLHDSASIFQTLGLNAEALTAHNLANTVKSGLDGRLDWNGENTDISQLGIAYPFNIYSYNDTRVNRVADRINGIATDTFGNNHPLVNFSGEHAGTINRYWNDNYWNGGPWFLSTLWYGLFYGERQDLTPGKTDIDNMKYRMDLCVARLGPTGMGAEQIAYGTGVGASLMYPGQQDFKLQTAWPNAWESMSTFADSVMKFLDYTPDAANHRMNFEPKLPSAWSTMTFNNVTLIDTPLGYTHKINLTVSEAQRNVSHTFINTTNHPLTANTVLRIDTSRCLINVVRNGAAIPYAYDNTTGRVTANSIALQTDNTPTIIQATFCSADVDDGNSTGTPDGGVGIEDLLFYLALYDAGDLLADVDDGNATGYQDGGVGIEDLLFYLTCYDRGCV